MGALCLLALLGGAFLRQRNEPASPRVTASRDACHSCDTKLPAPHEKELELLARVKSNYKANGPLDLKVLSGLSAAVDLGLLYLNDRQLDEADALFQQVCPRGVEECHGRLLHEVGKAMVLAYRDEPAESNKQFLAFLNDIDRVETLQAAAQSGSALPQAARDEIAIFTLLWNNENPAVSLREMVARALHHNFQNDPIDFPATLEPFRHPPRPSKARVTPRD